MGVSGSWMLGKPLVFWASLLGALLDACMGSPFPSLPFPSQPFVQPWLIGFAASSRVSCLGSAVVLGDNRRARLSLSGWVGVVLVIMRRRKSRREVFPIATCCDHSLNFFLEKCDFLAGKLTRKVKAKGARNNGKRVRVALYFRQQKE